MTKRPLTVSEKAAAEARKGLLDALLSGVASIFALGTTAASLMQGSLVVRSGRAVLRADEPVRFWCLIIVFSIVGVGLGLFAVVRWREGVAARRYGTTR